MRLAISRRIRHPFYPTVKASPAVVASGEAPAVYGTMEDLWNAAGSGVRVARAVFPLRRPGDPFLTDRQRDGLWQVFQVPVYALLVGRGGEVIGCECEAQAGLHLREGYADGLLFGRIETKVCDCGRPGLRLVRPVFEESAAAPEPARIAG